MRESEERQPPLVVTPSWTGVCYGVTKIDHGWAQRPSSEMRERIRERYRSTPVVTCGGCWRQSWEVHPWSWGLAILGIWDDFWLCSVLYLGWFMGCVLVLYVDFRVVFGCQESQRKAGEIFWIHPFFFFIRCGVFNFFKLLTWLSLIVINHFFIV